jgi:hypothetical protein
LIRVEHPIELETESYKTVEARIAQWLLSGAVGDRKTPPF